MYKKKVKVNFKDGLHIRPAVKLVKKSKSFLSDIYIISEEGLQVNAKSLFKLQSLGVKYNDIITICANGKDEKKAVENLCEFIKNKK
ncbi:MAG: HPr family phosphocarrier protein [Enterobacteriaceae bacterium]